MSIYVSISRRAYPFQEPGNEITVEEWLAVVDTAPDFRRPEGAEREFVSPDARVWTGHEHPVVFDFTSMGEIDVKSPPPRVIAKMKVIAARLGAIVFASETGEVFDDEGRSAGFVYEE